MPVSILSASPQLRAPFCAVTASAAILSARAALFSVSSGNSAMPRGSESSSESSAERSSAISRLLRALIVITLAPKAAEMRPLSMDIPLRSASSIRFMHIISLLAYFAACIARHSPRSVQVASQTAITASKARSVTVFVFFGRKAAGSPLDGLARPVACVLLQPGERIENGAFPDIRIPDKQYCFFSFHRLHRSIRLYTRHPFGAVRSPFRAQDMPSGL